MTKNDQTLKEWIVHEQISFTRKPYSFEECTEYGGKIPEEVMSVMPKTVGLYLVRPTQDLIRVQLSETQQYWILKRGSDFYFVDNQGYPYARYMVKATDDFKEDLAEICYHHPVIKKQRIKKKILSIEES